MTRTQTTAEPEATPTMVLSLNDLRGILSDEIMKIRAGQSSAAQVNAISRATSAILGTVKLQLDYCRLTGTKPNIPLLGNGSEPQD